MASMEMGPQSYNQKALIAANHLNELGSGFFPGPSREKCSLAQAETLSREPTHALPRLLTCRTVSS